MSTANLRMRTTVRSVRYLADDATEKLGVRATVHWKGAPIIDLVVDMDGAIVEPVAIRDEWGGEQT